VVLTAAMAPWRQPPCHRRSQYHTLVEYRFARIHRARNGEKGRGSDCYGKARRTSPCVSVGTVVTDIDLASAR